MSGSALWITIGHESVTRRSCQEFAGAVWKHNGALQTAEDLLEWELLPSGCLVNI